MLNGKTFLAIIPARGGSKRLPRKNILDLAGKPLIKWTIDAGLNSQFIDKVVVTSDSDEILEIAKQSNCTTIKRPEDLASDTSPTIDAIFHAINSINPQFDYIILLQPTSPLRTSFHIDEAIKLQKEKNADAIVSVCKMDHSPLWVNTLPQDGNMNNFIGVDIKNKRSQDLEQYYRLNGAIYICNTRELLDERSFFIKDNIYAYIMKSKHSIDIDSKFDLDMAKVYKGNI